MDEILRCGHSHETSPVVQLRLTEHKRTTRNGDVNNLIAEQLLQTKHQIDWDSATWIMYSTDYYQRLTLEQLHYNNYITSLHSQLHHGLTDRWPTTCHDVIDQSDRYNQSTVYNTINWCDTTHFDSEDDYRTGCQNVSHCQLNNSPIQDYIHSDIQTQPTFEMTPGFKPCTVQIKHCNNHVGIQ